MSCPADATPNDRLVPVTSSMIATKEDGVIFIICCENSRQPNEK